MLSCCRQPQQKISSPSLQQQQKQKQYETATVSIATSSGNKKQQTLHLSSTCSLLQMHQLNHMRDAKPYKLQASCRAAKVAGLQSCNQHQTWYTTILDQCHCMPCKAETQQP